MSNYLEQLKKNTDVRRTLISLKEALRADADAGKTLAELAGDFSVLTGFLKNEDAKARKNAALILGELGKVKGLPKRQEICDSLWNAYMAEETRFVKADYLKALAAFDCTPYLARLQERKEELETCPETEENEKHLRAEYAALRDLLLLNGHSQKHAFTGWDLPTEVILITNRLHRQTIAAQIPKGNIRMLAGGLRFVTENLRDVCAVRTWTELLFPLPGAKTIAGTPAEMAEMLLNAGFLTFLKSRHSKDTPFRFRLEVRPSRKESGLSREQEAGLVKDLAYELEQRSAGGLWNSVSDYELELRLVQGKDKSFIPLVKLFTLRDGRFAYRRDCLPTSISPVNAALLMELSGKYLTDGAQVLDPFCGAGTMLIERSFFGRVGDRYGIDTFGEAIEKARKNTERARMDIHYIHRNFFDFTHTYLFDEIITDLPAVGKTRTAGEVEALYERFLLEAGRVLKANAVLLLYTQSFEILEHCVKAHGEYRLQKTIRLNERDQSGACVLRYGKASGRE